MISPPISSLYEGLCCGMETFFLLLTTIILSLLCRGKVWLKEVVMWWYMVKQDYFPTLFHLACKLLELCCCHLQPFKRLTSCSEIHKKQNFTATLLQETVELAEERLNTDISV